MQKQRWDPSVKSLTAMPQVLEMMDAKIDWTQKVGDAFLAQQAQVMQTVQALRAKASAAGNLKSTPEQQVYDRAGRRQERHRDRARQPAGRVRADLRPGRRLRPLALPRLPAVLLLPARLLPGRGNVLVRRRDAWWARPSGAAATGAAGGVYINHHNYNNFNRSNIGGDSNWRHNVDHRKGVAYRDQATARQYNRDFSRDAQAREQFRGRGDGGRQATQRGDAARDPGGSAGGRDRGVAARDGPSAGTMDRGGASRDFSGGRSSGFEGSATAPARATSAAAAMRVDRAWSGSSGGFSRGGGGGGRGGGGRR